MTQSVTARVGNNDIRENVMKIEGLKDNAKDDLIENLKRVSFDEIKSMIGIHKPLQDLTSEGKTDDEKAMILVRKECKCNGFSGIGSFVSCFIRGFGRKCPGSSFKANQ